MIVDYIKKSRSSILKQKLIDSSEGQLSDEEILEMYLFLVQPKKDARYLAKQLLLKYGSFANIISVYKDNLFEMKEIEESLLFIFRLIHEGSLRLLKENIINKPAMESFHDLINYLKLTMGHINIEQFRIIYLDRNNSIMDNEIKQDGTIDYVTIYPREIIKKALILEATSIILVHNHPSGNLKPSKSDKELTLKIKDALASIGLKLLDHIIISRNGYFSFKENSIY
jgi:DNA repair protein RadC